MSPLSPANEDKTLEVSTANVPLRSHSVTEGSGSGLVQRLSMGFEKLEANARDTEIQLGVQGR